MSMSRWVGLSELLMSNHYSVCLIALKVPICGARPENYRLVSTDYLIHGAIVVELSPRHFGIGAKMSRHFGFSLMVPKSKCLGSELS